jgi:NDP-sugar pyrophosphorylase family protein
MNKINLIIPLNGIGSRFKEYTEPKPLIKIFDKEMIFWLLDNLDLSLVNKIFIPYNRKLRDYNFEQRVAERYTLEKIHLLCVPYDTLGAAEIQHFLQLAGRHYRKQFQYQRVQFP